MREIFSRIFCVLHLKLKKWQRSDNTFSSNFVKVEMAKPYYLDKALRIKVLSDLDAFHPQFFLLLA